MRNRVLYALALPVWTIVSVGCGQRADDAPPQLAAPARSQAADAAPGDWPAYNRTPSGDRFSPLAEIDRANVAGLQAVCSYALPEVSALQTGPLVIAGAMYFTTETRSYAIDAATCAPKWVVERPVERPSPLGVHRGFAYWNGRLFRGTTDAHVLALDAGDGHTLWDREVDAKAPGVTLPMAPIAADGLVFIGNAGGDQTGVTGHVYALDANDGRVVWRFDTVPASGPARGTWPNADRLPTTGGAFWTSFTLDRQRGVLYVPAGNPAPDFDAEARGGDNLYTNSIIALDAATGRMLGYNQIVKRDTHDWDVNSPPALATTKAGRTIVASANKDGMLSVLDRSRIASGTPGASTEAELASALPIVYQAATTTRENVDLPLSRTAPVRFCPGILGGNEWNGAAFDPVRNTLYTGSVDWCASVQLQAAPVAPPLGEIWFGSEGRSIQEPADEAKGWVTAFDADTGDVRWKFAAPAPVLAGVTPTAGGVVFSADLKGHLRAFDADSGAVLWDLDLGQAVGGGIVTYSAGGRQLLAVASGMKSPIWPGAADQSRIQVFGLGRSTP
ncbi:MAG TPA: PQQ-binding-like beta-propeller repeat protein [Gammaproteobacteria bacterium]|nr:PQQ-binding-like beta-propeller repeat protein [Gammaproteobacteria bacterium]